LVLDLVTKFYLASNDFNGITAEAISLDLRVPWQRAKPIVDGLIKRNLVEVCSYSTSANPYIKRLPFPEKEVQSATLGEELGQVCLYPHPSLT
jgi:hypothetical protein